MGFSGGSGGADRGAGRYAMLGDCQSAALVGPDGSVDWWCAPRFDSRSCFARLLDDDAGQWAIRPVAPYDVERAYIEDTMVLRTVFRTAHGAVALLDALALAPGVRDHRIGEDSPHVLVRLVEGLVGRVQLRMEFVPRLEYGLTAPALRGTAHGVETVGGPDRLLLTSDEPPRIGPGCRATLDFAVQGGQRRGFTLAHREGMTASDFPRLDARDAIGSTVSGWRSWAALHQGYRGFAQDGVRRGAMLLQALTYQPTGAIVAAATTSLPEGAGGSNWDYRYAWLRDASITSKALWIGACPDEAQRYFRWMALAGAGHEGADHVQIMFGVEGERDLAEHELDHLAGFRCRRPVRVGNAAWTQKQLDVLGEVLEAAWVLRERLDLGADGVTVRFLGALADRAATSWQEPDSGIWEGREGERHYLASKLMCWVALDRAVRFGDVLGAHADRMRWARAREEIRAAILDQGWNGEVGAFTGALGSDHLDAAALLIPLVGFLPATDPRVRRTIATVERDLGTGDCLLRRWTGASGEGAFVICSYWLADCLARAGEVERAEEVFERVTAYANDVGLLSEQVRPDTGELLANFPQAFSHAGLITAAWSIDQARRHHNKEQEEGSWTG